MKRTSWAFALLLAATPSCVIPQGVAGGVYAVINNTAQPQVCAIRSPHTNWSPWFRIGVRQTMQKMAAGGQLIIQCRPPVRQLRYALRPGTRYSLLRSGDSSVELTEIALVPRRQ